MEKKEFEEYLNLALATGADFVELYYEKAKTTTYRLSNSQLDAINNENSLGLGIRIIKNEECFYTSTNNLEKDNIKLLIKKLLLNFEKGTPKTIQLNSLVDKTFSVEIPHDKYPVEKKKKLLQKMDKVARDYSPLVTQVSGGILENSREFTIVNSTGKFIRSNSCITRIMSTIFVERDGIKEREFTDYAGGKGYEILNEFDLEKNVLFTTKTAIKKLDAKDFKGGEYPVVIAPGFGAVIFHEACGHGLEATSVAPKLSVFSNDYNKKIASEKVTLIDDGTIAGAWGSSIIDDEGNATQKNILIENGILTNFLVDNQHTKKMNQKSNGCCRRESYNYAPTSRMSNTYLAKGIDKVEDMIKSIDLGVYCERMSGGTVNTSTGDFNFAVETARLIDNGELTDYLKGITLIGNSKEILQNVEMVSDDLEISAGYCGSKSGMIPVTIGQPTIKVSKILVGGKE